MELQEFFKEYPSVALAFSGGADSSYLLYAAVKWADRVGVFYVRSPFQPEFEYRDAVRMARELGTEPVVLHADTLSDPMISANPENRCYFCKKCIMACIRQAAEKEGFPILIDGTNASDDISDRPGYKALQEENILSPLRICGITKKELRQRAREEGLFTWNKPAYACLATRIPTGERITAEKLDRIEKSESLLSKMGFSDFRVRTSHGKAKLQFIEEQQMKAQAQKETIRKELKEYFTEVTFDPISREKST